MLLLDLGRRFSSGSLGGARLALAELTAAGLFVTGLSLGLMDNAGEMVCVMVMGVSTVWEMSLADNSWGLEAERDMILREDGFLSKMGESTGVPAGEPEDDLVGDPPDEDPLLPLLELRRLKCLTSSNIVRRYRSFVM